MTYNRNNCSLFVPPLTQDHIQGALNGAVVFVMYGDYECFQSANVYRLIKVAQQQLNISFGENNLDFIYIDRGKFHEFFAQDVSEAEARVMAATQKPIASAAFEQSINEIAWKTIPSWFLVTQCDRYHLACCGLPTLCRCLCVNGIQLQS